MPRLRILAALLIFASPLLHAGERTEHAMGATFKISVEGDAHAPAVDRAMAEVHRLEAMLSTFRAESLVARLNRRDAALPVVEVDGEKWYEIPRELTDVFLESRRVHDATQGTFDPTVHGLLKAWGFETDAPRPPSKERLAQVLAGVGLKNVVLSEDGTRLRFLHPETQLNFGGIGKGFAMDRAAAILKEAGHKSGIVEFGRSFLVWGPPKDRPVDVEIVNPENKLSTMQVIPVTEGAVATSNQGGQYFKANGKRYGHILDPHTGMPVENSLLSVTVMAPTAAEADALSTGFFVLGITQAEETAKRLDGVSAVLIPKAKKNKDPKTVFVMKTK